MRFLKSAFVSAAAITCLFWATAPAAAQVPPERAAKLGAAAAKPTPRTADGKPDLTGYWADRIEEGVFYRNAVTKSADGKTTIYHEPEAPELDERAQPNFKARAANTSLRPKYKPEYVIKQREMMYTASRIDPGIHCYPFGVPRIGAPTEIVQTPGTMYFMYAGETDEDPTHTFRVIPIGTKHNPNADATPDGDSIAFWEGDTLVVDVTSLDPETWLSGDGTFHSDEMHVVERFTRKGDTLEYAVTVEDPKMFLEPWKPVLAGTGGVLGKTGATTRLLRPTGEHVRADYPCVERDREHKVNNDRF